MFFSHPWNSITSTHANHSLHRSNLTVKRSRTSGADWSAALVIEPWEKRQLFTTYSCLSDVPDASKLGILYEVGDRQLCTAASTSCKIVVALFAADF